MHQKVQPPYGGLLSSSCGGLKGPSGQKVNLADGRTDGRTTGLRELDYQSFVKEKQNKESAETPGEKAA